MPQLAVPPHVPDPARVHVHGLIAATVVRTAEHELERHRSAGNRLRAWRAATRLERLRAAAQGRLARRGPVGRAFRGAVRLAILGALALLALDLVVLGVHARLTAAADLAVVVLAFLWFFACAHEGPGEVSGELGLE